MSCTLEFKAGEEFADTLKGPLDDVTHARFMIWACEKENENIVCIDWIRSKQYLVE